MRFLSMVLPALVCLAGCGSGSDNGAVIVHPVTGKVMYDGKPAAGVIVTLIPTDAPMVPRIPQNPRATTGADGTFRITTFNDGDGAAEGGYQIVLSWPLAKDEKSDFEEAPDADMLLGWYDGTHSTINIRVIVGDNAVPTLNLTKVTHAPAMSPGVPGRN